MNPSPNLLARFAPLAPVLGAPRLLAHQADDLFGLWQAWEEECGAIRDVPYWGIVWPAARVLSQYLLVNPALARGRTVLDCGSGCGVTAIAAGCCGALSATGCDLDATAVAIARLNAVANGVDARFECRDVVDCCASRRFDLILVADLFYLQEFSGRLMDALLAARTHGSEVLIADSGRPFLPKEGLDEVHAQTAATSFDVEGCLTRTVRLYRLP